MPKGALGDLREYRELTLSLFYLSLSFSRSISLPGMLSADNFRTFQTNLLLHDAQTELEGGRENGWIVDNNPSGSPSLPPTGFLLFMPSLRSKKFVLNLRNNDIIDALCQHIGITALSLILPLIFSLPLSFPL